ncbi:hypothetical protein COU77_01605 [Candidatus Peregrinibacteria bacterium CG10_big_fil_rev_8_21_14_0_10_49_16]|nr:MAG: hypothetical protein COU77_01605 [Candidatus Peregrinibacteria bacterium CG10_big_fil_rev_8_21_14_0_10_49_16]
MIVFFHMKSHFTQGELLQNIIAGLTVSFVALSLGAAFGILSGRGAFIGMLSAALIPIITSTFGGTRVQCSGPTGPMTTVTAVMVAVAHDQLVNRFPGVSPDHLVNITLFLTAALLVLAGIFRLGKFVTYVPNVVVSGFMNGIAIIIWLDQMKQLFGISGKDAFEGPVLVNIAVASLSVTLVFILPVLLKKWIPPSYGRLLSGTLLTIIVMTVISTALQLPIEHVSLQGSLKSWSDITNIFQSQWPTHWSLSILLTTLPFAVQLAVLGYLDTLLTSLVIDKMRKEKTKQNKELIAQGLSAAAMGAIGGIPGAQATIRSVLIIKEHATLRIAGILVGVFALIEMILLQDAINLIPQAVFSGILLKVGYDVFDWTPLRLYAKEFIRDWHQLLHNVLSRHDDEAVFVTNREALFIAGTTLVTVLWDLNIAVGAFTALFYLLNMILMRKNPMRDLKPITETEGMRDEP